jgi:uncharacterized protein (TIGR03382 family)
MMRIWIAASAGLFGAACALGDEFSDEPVAARPMPVIGGTVTEGDPAVVALTTPTGSPFCSGTLISPSVVLTAAHCIDMAGGNPNITIFFGTNSFGEGTKIGVSRAGRHPEWTGNLGNYDIGMVLLNFPIDPAIAEPLPLNTSPTTDHVEEPYRVVGFGVYERETLTSDGRKREGTTTVNGHTSGDIVLIGDQDTVVCFGDSGGPGFLTIDDVEYVAGVHSYTTSSECYPPNGDTRVDLYVEDFILPWIQEYDPVCGLDGRCSRACPDDPDCLPCGPDGTCHMDCPLPDPDCPTSALGEICQADTQCMSGLCVFWHGEPTSKFCTRECSLGSDDCPAGMSCQQVSPFGTVCYYDDDPPGVIGSPCDDPTECGTYLCAENECVSRCDLSIGLVCPTDFECRSSNQVDYYCHTIPKPKKGCQASGTPAALLWALALLPLALRRRRPAQL